MKTTDNKSFIDIDEVFKSKNPSLYRILPTFFFNWLKKTVHQDEINGFIHNNSHLYDFEFVNAIIKEFGVQLKFEGLEHIPQHGGFICAANHPLGGLDAMSLLHCVGTRRKDVRFVVNDILLKLENLKGLFVGVNKHGKNDQNTMRTLDEIYGSGMGVLIFPAGLVSRRKKGLIKDLLWRKSFVVKARKHQIPIVPTFIEGKNSDFFYSLSNFRTSIGVKANIEMLYLVDEMYRQKGRTIQITFGKPVYPEALENPANDIEWSHRLREMVYELGNKQ
jgi:putative hemolysin